MFKVRDVPLFTKQLLFKGMLDGQVRADQQELLYRTRFSLCRLAAQLRMDPSAVADVFVMDEMHQREK